MAPTTTSMNMNLHAKTYYAAEAAPAATVFDYRKDPTLPKAFLMDESGGIRGFCLGPILTKEECEELIANAESEGIHPIQRYTGSFRTAKRTTQYQNRNLSNLVAKRVSDILEEMLEDNDDKDGFGEFHGIHPNWRIVRYDEGDSFCAHQDQMDSHQVLDPQTGTKETYYSSHTLLIHLNGSDHHHNHGDYGESCGGATRFYPRGKIIKNPNVHTSTDCYEDAVDVFLPTGWAMAFVQRGTIHAGQPLLLSGTTSTSTTTAKYVAQAGILRHCKGFVRPSVFRMGPGLEEHRDQQALSTK